MKFKVGDKVKIVADDSGSWKDSIGKVGVIEYILTNSEVKHPYRVVTDDYDRVPCNENELELITEEHTPTVGIIEELFKLIEIQEDDAEIDESIFRATVWIERRHGSTEALAYLKEALKDG